MIVREFVAEKDNHDIFFTAPSIDNCSGVDDIKIEAILPVEGRLYRVEGRSKKGYMSGMSFDVYEHNADGCIRPISANVCITFPYHSQSEILL